MTDTRNDTTELVRRRFGDAVAEAHAHSIHHRAEIEASGSCGCFYCMRVFGHEHINEWIDDGETALCPHCGIDSVLGSASGYEISAPFLSRMHSAWFLAQ
jgi:hypothetical protein